MSQIPYIIAKKVPVIEMMFNAQFGGLERSEIIESHMKEYFTRWHTYKDKLTHLEWYHVFLDFMESKNLVVDSAEKRDAEISRLSRQLEVEKSLAETRYETLLSVEEKYKKLLAEKDKEIAEKDRLYKALTRKLI